MKYLLNKSTSIRNGSGPSSVLWAVMMISIFLTGASAQVPNQGCPPSGTTCMTNQDVYYPGDTFILSTTTCNHENSDLVAAFFLVMEFGDQFYYLPTYDHYFDYELLTIPACSCVEQTIFKFVVPKHPGTCEFTFWNLILDKDVLTVIGNFSKCPVILKP